jgi:hypothetical protein
MFRNTFTIQTQDSISVVRQKLTGETETSSTRLTNLVSYASLRGRVSESGFKIARVYGGGAPITTIRGRFEEVPGGTAIHVIMNPVPMAIIIVLFLVIESYHSTVEQIPEITAQLNSLQLNITSIFSLLVSIISFIFPIGIPLLMSNLGWRYELEFYQEKLTKIFLGTT